MHLETLNSSSEVGRPFTLDFLTIMDKQCLERAKAMYSSWEGPKRRALIKFYMFQDGKELEHLLMIFAKSFHHLMTPPEV
jgi:hypothetical protein